MSSQVEKERQVYSALNATEAGKRFLDHIRGTYVNAPVIGDDPYDTYRRAGRRDFALFIVEMAEKHSG